MILSLTNLLNWPYALGKKKLGNFSGSRSLTWPAFDKFCCLLITFEKCFVAILRFINQMNTTSESFEARKQNSAFKYYEQLKVHAQVN